MIITIMTPTITANSTNSAQVDPSDGSCPAPGLLSAQLRRCCRFRSYLHIHTKMRALQIISGDEKNPNLSGWDGTETPTGFETTKKQQRKDNSDKRKLKLKMTNWRHAWCGSLRRSVICFYWFIVGILKEVWNVTVRHSGSAKKTTPTSGPFILKSTGSSCHCCRNQWLFL